MSPPSKQERQEAFRRYVQERGLTPAEANRIARLIPPEVVRQFKLIRWPR